MTRIAGYLVNGLPEANLKANPKIAMEYLREAAQFFRDEDAQFELAKLYLRGEGIESDEAYAKHWLSVLSQKGHAGAQAFLADLLWRGKYMRQDPVRALALISVAVANSPLVKTAIAGEDANWGRIVMAVGKSGERADRDKLRISIGGVRITDGGQVVPNYDEAPVAQHIKGQDVVIDIDLGIGRGRATVWTCDLTHGYIDINGSYRS